MLPWLVAVVGVLLLLLPGLGGALPRLLLIRVLLLLLLFLLVGVLWLVVLRHFRSSFRLAGKQVARLVDRFADWPGSQCQGMTTCIVNNGCSYQMSDISCFLTSD